MSSGFGVLKAIINQGIPLSEAAGQGVRNEKFVDKEAEAFQFITEHFNNYGVYPEFNTIEREIGHTVFSRIPAEPLEYWMRYVNERWYHSKLVQLRDSISDQLASGNDFSQAIETVANIHNEITQDTTNAQSLDMYTVQENVIEHHNRVQQMSTIPGIPFGLPFLDEVAGGIQAGDIVVIVGESGIGKTFLSIKFARAAREAHYNVLMVCTEMPELQVARRDLAMKAEINANDLKMGKLSEFSTNRLQRIIAESEERTNTEDSYYKILPGDIYNTFENISTFVKEVKPHLLIVDGAALIRSEKFKGSRWERIIEIIEKFKALALKESELRIILTFHYGKSGPGKQENIYGGMAISQFASMILSFEYERQEDKNNTSPVQYRNLKLLKGRDGETGVLRVLYDMRKSSIMQDAVIEGLNYEEQYDDSIEEDPEISRIEGI